MPNFLLTTFSGLPKPVTFFTLDPGIIAIANVLDNLHQDYSILDFNSDETLNSFLILCFAAIGVKWIVSKII